MLTFLHELEPLSYDDELDEPLSYEDELDSYEDAGAEGS